MGSGRQSGVRVGGWGTTAQGQPTTTGETMVQTRWNPAYDETVPRKATVVRGVEHLVLIETMLSLLSLGFGLNSSRE